jgi:trehalose 6-phosphate synthase
VPRERIAHLFRQAAVGLVTPLADGMNLVAKEYVAAQDPEDPGVLILSAFAGAAEQMEAAIIVNPYDLDQTAAAMATALSMGLEERRARHAELMADLRGREYRLVVAGLPREAPRGAALEDGRPRPKG